jgi:hypothetical protein
MRYLYGDSVPFPPQYDFLAALDVFCTEASRIVRLEAEGTALREAADAGAAERQRGVEELEVFHREALGALRDGATDASTPLVLDYVRQLEGLADRIVDDVGRVSLSTSEREKASARSEMERHRASVRDALERLLVAVRLPVRDTQITMSAVDGRNDFGGIFTHEDGLLVATFTLGGDEDEAWRAVRRVRDIAEGVSLPVGVKRSIFKRTVAAETISLDEYVIGGFELRDDFAEIRLRKKAEQPDSLVLRVRRVEDQVIAEVHYPDDAEADGLAPVLDTLSAAELERVWQLLRSACAPVLSRKKRLVSLVLGGNDVFDGDLGSDVVSLIVRVVAPIVAEVARRSPNASELSLKVENDLGRREEIYLKKAQLAAALVTVPAASRAVFEPLGLLGDAEPKPLSTRFPP